MLESLPRPIIFAQRGDSAHAPENTLSAFQLAQANGAEAIQLEAKLSADGHVVVFHDPTLERTTNGTGRISDKTLGELRALDAGRRFSRESYGERIPLLSDVLELLGKKLLIDIELSNYQTPRDGLVQAVCELVKRREAQRSVIFSSFRGLNLRMAAALLPQVPRGLLARPGVAGAWARSFGFSFGDYAALHSYVADTSPQEVQRVHRLRRRVHVWGANMREQIRRLLDWGVDGIITPDPQLALQMAGRRA